MKKVRKMTHQGEILYPSLSGCDFGIPLDGVLRYQATEPPAYIPFVDDQEVRVETSTRHLAVLERGNTKSFRGWPQCI